MLKADSTALVVVDMQEKLFNVMKDKEDLLGSMLKMVRGAKILGLPIVFTEQNPKGLGPTLSVLAEELQGFEPVTKLSFSCCGETRFMEELRKLEGRTILIGGIEAHVCVYQTVRDLVRLGFPVQVVADCVSSRTKFNRSMGQEKCKEVGASLTTVEMALFEMLEVAEGEKFKKMLPVLK